MTPSEHYTAEQDEFSLIELLILLIVNRRLIVACFLIFAALGLTYAYVIKSHSFTATAIVITNKSEEIGIAPEMVLSLAQSEAIKQPLMTQLNQEGFISDADIANDLNGIYTASINVKTGQIQLSIKLDNAEAAQKHVNETAQRITAEAKRMQLSTVSQRIGKLESAKADIEAEIAAIPVQASKEDIDQNEFLTYALPIAALEASVILQGGEKQLVQKIQDNAVLLLQDSKAAAINDREKKNLFMHAYKTLVKQSIERELRMLKQQEQTIVLAMPAPLPKKADKPSRALISLLFMMAGGFIGCCAVFVRAAIENPETKAQWQRLRNALRN